MKCFFGRVEANKTVLAMFSLITTLFGAFSKTKLFRTTSLQYFLVFIFPLGTSLVQITILEI